MSEASADRAPALFGHCVTTYEAMLAEATEVQEGNVAMIVWEGFPTKLILKELRMSTPYYTSILRALKAMGCARQLRRGGSTTPSQWELLKEPDLETFLEEAVSKEPSLGEIRLDAIEQGWRDISRRVERLEQVAGLDRIPLDYTTPAGGIRVLGVEG